MNGLFTFCAKHTSLLLDICPFFHKVQLYSTSVIVRTESHACIKNTRFMIFSNRFHYESYKFPNKAVNCLNTEKLEGILGW